MSMEERAKVLEDDSFIFLSSSYVTRRDALPLIGIFGGLLVQACKGALKKQEKSPEKVSEKNEIMLGNMRFFLSSPCTLSLEQRGLLFSHMEKAYSRLTQEFGKELMTAAGSELKEIPILFQSETDTNADVQFDVSGEIDIDGNPLIREVRNPRLHVKNFSETVLAHELAHIFLQGVPFFSQAFGEGSIYAIEGMLYPGQETKGFLLKIAEQLLTHGAFRIPLDFNQLYLSVASGADHSQLYDVAEAIWQILWLQYFRQNPNFLKDFYFAIRAERDNGKKFFSKKDLIGIASKVDPDFQKWYGSLEAAPLRDMGTERNEVVGAFRTKNPDFLIISNFRVELFTGKISTARKEDLQFRILTSGDPEEFDFSGRTGMPFFAVDIQDLSPIDWSKAELFIGKNKIPIFEL